MGPEHIIIKPISLTEKATRQHEDHNQVTFEVRREANKIEIKNAVETLFKVGVVSVRTQIVRGKKKRLGRSSTKLPNWKKAIVTLVAGNDIRFYENEGT